MFKIPVGWLSVMLGCMESTAWSSFVPLRRPAPAGSEPVPDPSRANHSLAAGRQHLQWR